MNELDNILFSSLVIQYQQIGMIGLGKIPGPDGLLHEVDLNTVQFAIQFLEMLERKCKGNLTTNEEKLLQNELTTLRLNYVEEFNKKQKIDETKSD